MWALGHVDDLGWPGRMCDVESMAKLLAEKEDDPFFILHARLRPVREMLDAQDVTMRIRWAIRDADLHRGGTVPDDLDWSGQSEQVPVRLSQAVLVVQERHHALNWLVRYLDPENWDAVDTPT